MAVFPEGFTASVVPISFFPKERESVNPYEMNLSLIVCREGTETFGGVFTKNKVQGSPVLHAKTMMNRRIASGILINNKIANVCSPSGMDDINTLLRNAEQKASLIPDSLFSASTGIIGWGLPVDEMIKGMDALSLGRANPLDVAQAIMTTDSYPKLFSRKIGEGSILGIAKGAGMIEPNLATMLVFILTDIEIQRDTLCKILRECVSQTFNCISVDGDQSTSDMVIAMSSRKYKGVDSVSFKNGLLEVCGYLSRQIVRNGEGTSHVIRTNVLGAKTVKDARLLAKGIVNSPLVKTAVYGNDPNIGRIISALGDTAGNFGIPLDMNTLKLTVEDEQVFESGVFCLDKEKEDRLSNYLREAGMVADTHGFPSHNREVVFSVHLGMGEKSGYAVGSDLSKEYVKVNADYRT